MTITPVNQNNFSAAIALLKKNNLPTEDLTDTSKLFVLLKENELLGVIGIEIVENLGLLRSLCVTEESRKNGSGQELVSFIENFARQQGVRHLYLLTTTAENFFNKRQYKKIDRENTPEAIRQSKEFSSICPSSAVVMVKQLV